MPAMLALKPLAWTALRLGAVAVVALYTARRSESQPKNAEHATVLDDLPDGIEGHSHNAEAERAMHGAGRFRRTFRFTPGGPGLEVDAAALGRIRFRRVE